MLDLSAFPAATKRGERGAPVTGCSGFESRAGERNSEVASRRQRHRGPRASPICGSRSFARTLIGALESQQTDCRRSAPNSRMTAAIDSRHSWLRREARAPAYNSFRSKQTLDPAHRRNSPRKIRRPKGATRLDPVCHPRGPHAAEGRVERGVRRRSAAPIAARTIRQR